MDKISHRPQKKFSQNFLVNESIIDEIIAHIQPTEKDLIVEIGPGLGALTTALLSGAKKITAIELDRSLIQPLKSTCEPFGQLDLYCENAVKFDFSTLAINHQKIRVVGNLPYHISTPLIFHLLQFRAHIQDMHFMLQEEVVDRMVAPPNSKTYGRLSVMTQYYCRAEKLFTVPPDAFYPSPKVYSAIVRLMPHEQLPYPATDFKRFETLVLHAFSQRRKTLRNALKKLVPETVFHSLHIDPQQRPENVDVQSFVALANHLGG